VFVFLGATFATIIGVIKDVPLYYAWQQVILALITALIPTILTTAWLRSTGTAQASSRDLLFTLLGTANGLLVSYVVKGSKYPREN
jgi:hypothetical protein